MLLFFIGQGSFKPMRDSIFISHWLKIDFKIDWSQRLIGRPQRDQEFSIPGFLGRDFAKSRDPGIFRDGISLKFQSRDFREL